LLHRTNLKGAYLEKADLSGAILDEAYLEGAYLVNAIWTDGTTCKEKSIGRCVR
ncbi:MAG: pentapeptide repeat-containing protein, partial [SAR324 cluster bacterium]|nr:pentapeptide repeat-containing protein [SAR324 cluster bacterium]